MPTRMVRIPDFGPDAGPFWDNWSGFGPEFDSKIRTWSGKPVFTLQSCRPAVELSMVIRAQNIYFWALMIFIVQNPDFGPDFQILVRILVYFGTDLVRILTENWSGFGLEFQNFGPEN